MVKTQIQLPDEVYERLKRLAARLEVSMAELLRRGAEYVLNVHPVETSWPEPWRPPEPLDLGAPRVPVEQWRELANEAPLDESNGRSTGA